jgi:8-oxo-dGTP pyrophosphatase MutT (NUDIX family)
MPHIHELYDFTVTVFIVYEGKTLLVHHPRYGKWVPMGGHIELDEDPEEALYREVEEETGLEVEIINKRPDFEVEPGTKLLPVPNFMDVHDANAPHRHIGLIYFAVAKHDNHVLSAEHTDIRWLGEADLDKAEYDLDPSVKFYCREAFRLASAL